MACKCIQKPRVGSGTWCGKQPPYGLERPFFEGLDHAAAAIEMQTTAQPCRSCVAKAWAFLKRANQNGERESN